MKNPTTELLRKQASPALLQLLTSILTPSFSLCTVKLGFKEQLNKQQLGNSKTFTVTNIPVHLMNNEQIGNSEQMCDEQKVPYYQVRL